jgi:hypothetical protein
VSQPGERLRHLASRACSDRTMRRLVDPVIADLQFERADALARGDRWRAHVATCRAVAALGRILWHGLVPALRDELATDAMWRIGRAVFAATALLTMPIWMLSLFVVATGGYPSMQVTIAHVVRLLLYLSPTALGVTIPMGLSIGVLVVCGSRTPPRHVRATVVLLSIAATALACALFIGIAPLASQAYRDLASPPGIELRVNQPGSVPYQLEQYGRWALVCGNGVLAAFAATAAAASRRRTWIGAAAGLASLLYPFLSVPIGVLASERALPVLLAAWLPNLFFATATLLLIGWNRIGYGADTSAQGAGR